MSLLVTFGILVVLGVVGGGRRPVGAARMVGGVESGTSGGSGMELPVSAEVPVHPLDPAPRAEWEVLTGCQLVKTPTNAAHHFRVKRDEKPMVFALYLVRAPELTEPDEDEVEEWARYFGWPKKWSPEECADRVLDLGEQAWREVEALLEVRPFIVLTRFDRRREMHHFYALVVIEDEQGNRRTLQEWLVERGYGTIEPAGLGWLPLQVSSEQYFERLDRLQQVAQRERRGGWGVGSEVR
jgi:endonuclease YncB( thermonuclease family)